MSVRDPYEKLREQLSHHALRVHERGFATATNGNISVRTGPDECLISPSGCSLGEVAPADFVLVDGRGQPRDRGAAHPSAEVRMHLAVYAERPDVEAVLHAHPPIAIALSIAGHTLEAPFIPEVVVSLGRIPTLPYTLPASAETAEAVRTAVRKHDALLLERHGTVTVGASLREAYLKLETVEHAAHVIWLARQVGEAHPLAEPDLERLRALAAELRQRSSRGVPTDPGTH